MLKISDRYVQDFFNGNTVIEGFTETNELFDEYDILEVVRDILNSNQDIKVNDGRIPLFLLITEKQEAIDLQEVNHGNIHVTTIPDNNVNEYEFYKDYVNTVMEQEDFAKYQLIGIFIDDKLIDFEDIVGLTGAYMDIPIIVGYSAFL